MSKIILCPTRGGQASYPNQERAAMLAKERDAKLIFLYVSDVEFLSHTIGTKVVDIETELDEMGDFLLTMAIERAGLIGVEASGIVKRGNFREALIDTLEKYSIDTIVIGKSMIDSSVLPPSYIESLAEQLSSQTGVEIILVHNGEIISVYNK